MIAAGVDQHATRAGRAGGALYAGWVTALLCLLYVVSFVDRHVMSLLVGPIRADMNIDDTQMSLLLGASFAVFYAVFGLPLARLADNGNRRNLILAAVTFWSLATALSGLAHDFHVLLICRMGVALGEGALTPAALSMIADLYPPEQRARGASLYMATGLIGAFGAFIVSGAVLQAIVGLHPIVLAGLGALAPWRLVFLLVSAPGLLLTLLFALTVREPERRGEAASEPVGWRETFDYLRRSWRTYVPLFVGVALSQFTCFAIMAWYPTELIRQYGLKAQQAGWLFGAVGMLAVVSGALIVPRFADTRQRVQRGGLPLVLMIATAAGIPFAILHPLAPSAVISTGLAATALFLLIGVGVTPNVAVQSLAPNRYRGQLAACFMLINNLGGSATAPTIVAILSDRSFHGPGALGRGMLTLSAITLPLSMLMLFLAFRSARAAATTVPRAE
jgi:MFS family permease